MNRKFAYGCLGVLGLAAVAALLFLYVNVLRPAQEIMADLRQLGDLTEMNALVTATDRFIPPTDGAVTGDQMMRFAGVQTAMRDALGSDYEEIRLRSGDLRGMRRDEDGSITKPGFQEVVRAFKGLGPLLQQAKRAQVDALNAHAFSYDEYRWVRESTYRALGQKNADVYLEEFADKVLNLNGSGADSVEARGSTDTTEAPIIPITPSEVPRNRILAAAYADSLESWRPFLIFGL